MFTVSRMPALVVAGLLLAACGTTTRPTSVAAPKRAPAAAGLGNPLPVAGPVVDTLLGNGRPGMSFTIWEYDRIRFTVRMKSSLGKLKYKWTTNGHYWGKDDQPAFEFAPLHWGDFDVECTVTDDSGQSDSADAHIWVYPNNPIPTPFPPVPPIPVPIPPHAQ